MGFLWIFLSIVLYQGTSAVDPESVSVIVKEGDSVTLNTDVIKKQNDSIKWYYNDTRIAQINGDLGKSCTDVQCNNGTERFRGRLKLDHQTGSLTIMNIRNTDSGVYQLTINKDTEKIFRVSVHGVSAAERDEVKRKSVKEGESVTLDPGVTKNQNDLMKWYFNEILIAEITGDQSKNCTDVQCEERFRDRLNLDHQTGSVTIMNTRNTDSGDYKLKISSISFSSEKIFHVSVTGSGLSSGVVAGIVVGFLLVFVAAAAVGVIYYHRWISRNNMAKTRIQFL